MFVADDLREAENKCNAAGDFVLSVLGAWSNAKCEYSSGVCVAKDAPQCAAVTGAALDTSTACDNLSPGALDTVETADSCTSTLVAAPYTVVTADTAKCQLTSGDASFGTTPGSCSELNPGVATCAYVGGLYSASGSECTYVAEACKSVCAVVAPDRTGANCLAAGAHCVWSAPEGSCANSDGESVEAATQILCESTTTNVWTESQAETCLPADSNDDTGCSDVMAQTAPRGAACAAALGGGRCVHVQNACVATHATTCAQANFVVERDVCESRRGGDCTGTADDASVRRSVVVVAPICLCSLIRSNS
jgi:hypothetical protein